MKQPIKDIFLTFVFFTITLFILYLLWLPFSYPYLWVRNKISLSLLTLFGFYKEMPVLKSIWSGEYFSFLPFLALMVTTYKKQVLKYWKYILMVMLILIFMEVMGRFFSDLAEFYPTSIFVGPLAVFLLATARPAFPFLFWLYRVIQDKQ